MSDTEDKEIVEAVGRMGLFGRRRSSASSVKSSDKAAASKSEAEEAAQSSPPDTPRAPLTDEQQEKLKAMKKILAATHGEEYIAGLRDLEERGLVRFLRARKWNVEEAAAMTDKYMLFRKKYNVDNITAESVEAELKTGKAFLHGKDKLGRPCIVVQLRYHDASGRDLDTLIRFVFYMFEEAIARMEDPTDTLVILYDRSGMTRKNFDLGVIKLVLEMAGIMQDFYAERLGLFIVLYPNWFFWTMWKAVSLIIDKKTSSKFKMMSDVSGLSEYFEPEQLQVAFGGTSTHEFSYPNSLHWPKRVAKK